MIRYVKTIIKKTEIINLFTTSIKWRQLKLKEGNVAQKSDFGNKVLRFASFETHNMEESRLVNNERMLLVIVFTRIN